MKVSEGGGTDPVLFQNSAERRMPLSQRPKRHERDRCRQALEPSFEYWNRALLEGSLQAVVEGLFDEV